MSQSAPFPLHDAENEESVEITLREYEKAEPLDMSESARSSSGGNSTENQDEMLSNMLSE